MLVVLVFSVSAFCFNAVRICFVLSAALFLYSAISPAVIISALVFRIFSILLLSDCLKAKSFFCMEWYLLTFSALLNGFLLVTLSILIRRKYLLESKIHGQCNFAIYLSVKPNSKLDTLVLSAMHCG